MLSIDRKGGYTLLEVMAVTLIIALVASLVITMTPGTGRAGLKAATLQAAALLRRERAEAILAGRERHVSLDGGRRILVGEGGDTVAIPRDVAVDLLGADAVWAGRQAIVRFDPDGAHTHMLRHVAGYALAGRGVDTRILQALWATARSPTR